MSEEEKQTIEYLKARFYGNEGCKIIDVAQSDLRIFLKLVENLQKDIESWKKYCNEQENDIILKNNKICDLEFKIEKQSKEIEELEEKIMEQDLMIDALKEDRKIAIEEIQEQYYVSKDKIKEIIDKIDVEDYYCLNEAEEDLRKLVE